MRRAYLAAAAVICLGACAACGADGLVVESKTRNTMKLFGPPVHQESVQKAYYIADKIRTENEGEEGYTILDFSDGKEIMYEVSPKTRTYMKTDLVEMRKQAEAMRKQLEERMKQMRQQGGQAGQGGNPFAGLLGGAAQQRPTGPITVKKTDTTSRIAGYTAKLVVFEQGGREVLRVWHTDKVKSPADIPTQQLTGGMGRPGADLIEKRKELGGFELGSRMDMGNVKVEATVTKVQKKSLPASLFKVPAGYKEAERRAPVPGGGMGGMGGR